MTFWLVLQHNGMAPKKKKKLKLSDKASIDKNDRWQTEKRNERFEL